MPSTLCCEKEAGASPYHPACLKALCGSPRPPRVPFGLSELAQEVVKVRGRMSISGVQIKASVRVEEGELSVVAEGGTHVLKPQPLEYPGLPATENFCMNLARAMGLKTPPHALVAMADGTLAYIVRRFDRTAGGEKLHKETAYQALAANDKYKGSLESVGKLVLKHSRNMGLDALELFERAVFCHLTGNGDMHLKNWSLLRSAEGSWGLAPCYDLVSSKAYLPKESDSALTVNGKHDKLRRKDFDALAASLRVVPAALEAVYARYREALPLMREALSRSHLDPARRAALASVLEARHARLFK